MSKKKIYLGIDGGATKMMVQAICIPDQSNLAYYDKFHDEICYKEMPEWNNDFQPEDIGLQEKSAKEKIFDLSYNEKKQGEVIINTLRKLYNQALKRNHAISGVGLCFPGLKTKFNEGIILLVNGPRIPDFVLQLRNKKIPINNIYNDSECCVLGEIRGQSGALRDVKHGIYIGGGTGIADGIVIGGNIANFNHNDGLKRSWELIVQPGVSIESRLSPKNLIANYNAMSPNKLITSLESLIILAENDNPIANKIISKAVEAIQILISNRVKYIYGETGELCEKIVIGQRLALALSSKNGENIFMNKIYSALNQDIPISLSTDRKTATLGAAWKASCS